MAGRYSEAEARAQEREWVLAMRKALPPGGPYPWPQMTLAMVRLGLIEDAIEAEQSAGGEGMSETDRALHVYFCDGTVPALPRGWYWRRQSFMPGMYGRSHGPFPDGPAAREDAANPLPRPEGDR